MGTRSLTRIYNEDDKLLVTMYRQMDGYPAGHGLDLAEFLKDFKIVNGLTSGQPKAKIANGMGCLAAQIIAYFKEEPGGIYIEGPKTSAKDCNAEYVYQVYEDRLIIRAPSRVIFSGTWSEAYEFCKSAT